jgi:hypothetical protein
MKTDISSIVKLESTNESFRLRQGRAPSQELASPRPRCQAHVREGDMLARPYVEPHDEKDCGVGGMSC